MSKPIRRLTKEDVLAEARERLDSMLATDNDAYDDMHGVGSYEDDLAFIRRVIKQLES